jgi:hypothetical protein
LQVEDSDSEGGDNVVTFASNTNNNNSNSDNSNQESNNISVILNESDVQANSPTEENLLVETHNVPATEAPTSLRRTPGIASVFCDICVTFAVVLYVYWEVIRRGCINLRLYKTLFLLSIPTSIPIVVVSMVSTATHTYALSCHG